MIRDQPDVVILDSRRSNLHRTLARWALWSGVRVVTATAGAGPGTAAAEARAEGTPRESASQTDLDLRSVQQIWLPGESGAFTGQEPSRSKEFESIIDLHRPSWSPGPRLP
jgi:hypothetical protein